MAADPFKYFVVFSGWLAMSNPADSKTLQSLLTLLSLWRQNLNLLVVVFQRIIIRRGVIASLLPIVGKHGPSVGVASGKCVKKRRNRRYWTRPGRVSSWWTNILRGISVEEEWYENFRMTRSTFSSICEKLASSLSKQDTCLRKSIPVETQIAVALYYLADEGRYRKAANAFGISRASVCHIIKRVTKAIVQILGPEYLAMPKSAEGVKYLVENFKKIHRFPNCIGAVDGTHIEIRKPSTNATDFINRKGRTSLNVQALCDFSYRFLDVCVKWPGSVHDARVFANSNLNKVLSNGELPIVLESIVDGHPAVPTCILGDAAYALKPFLMKEFPGRGATADQQHFGLMLSSARMAIECSFGRLKGRWGALRRPLDVDIKDVPDIIYACFVLHNICETAKEPLPKEVIEKAMEEHTANQPRPGNVSEDPVATRSNAVEIRNTYVKYFKQL